MKFKRQAATAALFAGVLLLASGCGDDGGDSDDNAADASSVADCAEQSGDEIRTCLYEAAKEEGSVTVFYELAPEALESLTKAFEQEYPGVKVQGQRLVGNEQIPKLDAGRTSGNMEADVALMGGQEGFLNEWSSKGYLTEPIGPSFQENDYPTGSDGMPTGDYFWVASSAGVVEWNTDVVKEPIEDYCDVDRPDLDGKIGLSDPEAVVPMVAHYQFMEEQCGADFLDRLAKLHPKVYPGVGPVNAALLSGEVGVQLYGGSYLATTQKAQGLPVDFSTPPITLTIKEMGLILADAPHPAAAQLMADFMVSPAGQDAQNLGQVAPLAGVEGAIELPPERTFTPDYTKLTPETNQEFFDRFNELFKN